MASCTPFSAKERNSINILPSPVPGNYQTMPLNPILSEKRKQSEIGPHSAWWESFNSEDLNNLETIALSHNFDILTAWARLKQSAALADKSFSNIFPQIGMEGSRARNIRTTQITEDSSQNSQESDAFGLNFSASYELDFWGRLSSERKAADLRLEASKEDMQTAAISVAASVAETWVDLLGNRAEFLVLQRQIEVNKSLVLMQETRFANALAKSLDVLQQREALLASRAEAPQLEQNAIVLRDKISILLGKISGDIPAINENAEFPKLSLVPDVGLPVELLEMRPDIRAAWAKLQAADWDTSQARANRFPAIKLSASQAFSAPETSLMLLNWVTNLVASLTFPLFDGGKLSAEEARIRAQAEEAVQIYAKTVAIAIQEVNNTLSNDVAQQNKLYLLRKQFSLSNKASEASLRAYIEGSDTFLRFISQLKATQNLERILVQQRVTVLRTRIGLYRALGGRYFPEEVRNAVLLTEETSKEINQ